MWKIVFFLKRTCAPVQFQNISTDSNNKHDDIQNIQQQQQQQQRKLKKEGSKLT